MSRSYTPLPHQVADSAAMLLYNHAYLWADAGTGKTVTAMEAFRTGPHQKLIVVCPRIALYMWKRELETYLMRDSKVGNDKFYARVLASGSVQTKYKNASGGSQSSSIMSADALILTYDLVAKHEALLRKFVIGDYDSKSPLNPTPEGSTPWQNRYSVALIADEAHMVKSKDAKRTKALFGNTFTPKPENLAGHVDDIWQLTGTPVMRYFDDLWTQLHVGRADVLKHYNVNTYEKWINMFCVKEYRQYSPYGPKTMVIKGNRNHKLLEQVLDACKVIRRSLESVVDDLPPITHRVLDTEYKGVPRMNLNEDALIRELNNPDSEAAKVRRVLGMAKADSVVAYAAEYGKMPLLIGYWHRDVGDMLEAGLSENLKVVRIDGSTPIQKREEYQGQFNRGEVQVLLGQMRALNTSANLQGACSHVIIAEEDPSPGLVHQFYSRVHRRGQRHHVQVDYMQSDHDIDVALAAIRDRKAADNERVGV